MNKFLSLIAYSLLANQKGQPLIHHWLGVYFKQGKLIELKPIEAVFEQIGLQNGLPNSAEPDGSITELKDLLPEAISAIKVKMREARDSFEKETRSKLDAQLEKLKVQENKHFEQLDLFTQNSQQLVSVKEKRQRQETEAIRSRFEEYRQWIKETMNTEDQPYIQIVAAIIH
jgi:anion-transporting  ArsA/GET3 family ATPase